MMNLLTRAYAPVYRNLVFPVYEGILRRRGIYGYYRGLSDAPAVPREKLLETQRRRLNELLVYCNANVPFYRELFALRGVDPRKVSDVETLRERGIFTSKAIIRSAGESVLSCEFAKEELHNSATSGSTGSTGPRTGSASRSVLPRRSSGGTNPARRARRSSRAPSTGGFRTISSSRRSTSARIDSSTESPLSSASARAT
jgi:hypothetical protein